MLKSINRNFVLTVLTVSLPIVMQFFYIRYVSYNVNKVDYGNFTLLQTVIAALSYIFIQVPSQAYDRFYNSAGSKIDFVNEFRTIVLLVNVLSFFLIIIYGYFMGKFSYDVLMVLAVYYSILNIFTFNQKIFLLNLQRGHYFCLKIIESLAKFVCPILGYFYFKTLLGFLLGLASGYLISYIILIKFMNEHKFNIEINIHNLVRYFNFAYPVLFVSIFTWGISFADRYFIEFLLGTNQVAIYSLLAQVAAVGQIIGQVYSLYVYPKVLKLFEEDKDSAFIYMSRTLNILAIIFVFFTVIAYVLPIQVYEILLEKEVIEQQYYFMTFFVLIIGIFVTVFQTSYSMYLSLMKRLNVLAYIYFIALIVNLVINFIYIKQYGILVAAISTLLSYIVILVLQILYVKRTRLIHS